jgi:hypothetical protein
VLVLVVDRRLDPKPVGIGRDPLDSMNARDRIANDVDGPVHVRRQCLVVGGIAQQQRREQVLGDQEDTKPQPVDPQQPER